MPFYIHVAHPQTRKYLVVRLHQDNQTEVYQVIGNGSIVTFRSNRPYVRTRFGKGFIPFWITVDDHYNDSMLEKKIVSAIMEIIDL